MNDEVMELTLTTSMTIARRMSPLQRSRKQSGLVKRNELCPCGSTQKFKKCCLPKINFPCFRKSVTEVETE